MARLAAGQLNCPPTSVGGNNSRTYGPCHSRWGARGKQLSGAGAGDLGAGLCRCKSGCTLLDFRPMLAGQNPHSARGIQRPGTRCATSYARQHSDRSGRTSGVGSVGRLRCSVTYRQSKRQKNALYALDWESRHDPNSLDWLRQRAGATGKAKL